ncbi:putative nucleotidyltransferase substrate binding domain-containing protein [Paracoccus xiamenensis]|uniref:putative nucleotidyltransferase substrate binding domain-containing protein n=1 Tax=Paracoccus xiamenensis TaxID=2714901 RepID=UPI001409A945|nr:putative nucleotidyltransferase substrate binding domain-containing protein [Paracoccus xiamenensis]NHF72197.1 CBS domain-containing protein [Paracoccus xiamenensis]
MEAIDALISVLHPYDTLSEDERARVVRSFARSQLPEGAMIYTRGQILDGLYIVENGAVEITDANGALVSLLERGNSFGERGLLADGRAVTTARMARTGTVLLLPAAEFRRLIAESPDFARFFERGGRERSGRGGPDVATLKISDILTRSPVTTEPTTPIREAARIMREAKISSLGITDPDGRLLGLVTIRDMSNRVVAEGLDLQAPVSTIMTSDPVTLPPDALGSDVLHAMIERSIGHLPVIEAGRLVGMVTQTDLTRLQAISTSVLIHDVAGAETVEQMAEVTARIPDLLVSLVAGHQRHEVVTRLITDIADAVTRRLLAMAQDKLGPAPAAWLWAACGSQGRQDQTGVSDQDNVLILSDEANPDDPWFAELARFVSDGLNTCGYVYCPGDMMATNPRWGQPRRVWRKYFADWIANPSPEAQMLASVMFDLRAIGGDASLLAGLQSETLAMASANSIFVAHMISNSLKHQPPLGLIRGFATIRSGQHQGHIDMKMNGVVPVADLARVYALKGQLTPVNTRARLEAAEAAGVISGSGARDLIAAYDLIQTLRLQNQAHLVRAGRKPDNYLSPADLADFERSHLRDAFVVVRTMQSALGQGRGVLG